MPDLHDLPGLVDPSDFELSPAQQRRLWLRNHAFTIAFAVTFVLVAVLTVRVVTLEARHSAPVPAVASASEPAGDARPELIPTAAATKARPADEPAAEEPAVEATPVEEDAVTGTSPGAGAEQRARVDQGSVLTPRAVPAPHFDPVLHAALTQPPEVPEREARRERRVARRTARGTPPRVVEVAAVPPRAVAEKADDPADEPPSAGSGVLTIQVQPWGSVFINDRLVQREVNARFKTRLRAGTYPVRVVHPVLGTWRGVARVQPGKEVALFVSFNR